MALPVGSTKAAEKFARAVIRRKWEDILPLLAKPIRERMSAESLADEFGWKKLEPRLRQMHEAIIGEESDPDDTLDPPKRFEVFEVEEEVGGELVRQPPAGHDPSVPLGWIEVDFLPSEDSGFDTCYNCFLAFIDESGPRITAYAIESATE